MLPRSKQACLLMEFGGDVGVGVVVVVVLVVVVVVALVVNTAAVIVTAAIALPRQWAWDAQHSAVTRRAYRFAFECSLCPRPALRFDLAFPRLSRI